MQFPNVETNGGEWVGVGSVERRGRGKRRVEAVTRFMARDESENAIPKFTGRLNTWRILYRVI